MKKFNLSLVTVLAMSTFAVAGGDIAPVESMVETVVEEVSAGSFYAGIAYSRIGADITNIKVNGDTGWTDIRDDVELDMGALMIDAGYKFNDYVAVEARYWIGIDADDVSFSDWTVHDPFDTDADAWGVYVKPMYPVTDAFDIYGLLGYGSASLNDSKTFDGDVEGISWGVGAAYSFTESFSVFLDYVAFTEDTLKNNSLTHLVGVDDTEYDHAFDTINFGLNYQF